MTITSAIRSLRDGQATRPSTWRGYIERIDKALDPEYSTTTKYSVGDKIQRYGRRYVCVAATPDSGEAFDPDKWALIDTDCYIVFVDADDSISGDGDTHGNPSAVFLGTVDGPDNIVSWTRLTQSDAVPDEVTARHPSWDGNCPDPADMPDKELFEAMLADTWENGSAADYEIQRIGDDDRRW